MFGVLKGASCALKNDERQELPNSKRQLLLIWYDNILNLCLPNFCFWRPSNWPDHGLNV
jgi:hypothetical protein